MSACRAIQVLPGPEKDGTMDTIGQANPMLTKGTRLSSAEL